MPILDMTLLEYFDKEHDEHVYDLFRKFLIHLDLSTKTQKQPRPASRILEIWCRLPQGMWTWTMVSWDQRVRRVGWGIMRNDVPVNPKDNSQSQKRREKDKNIYPN